MKTKGNAKKSSDAVDTEFVSTTASEKILEAKKFEGMNKTEETKKTGARNKIEATKKTGATRKTEKIIVQYAGNEIDKDSILKSVKQAWKAEGNKEADITGLEVYIKPEDNAVYYVVNGIPQGKIQLM